MKINLKLIAICFIILYCLAPLSAVEFNTCDTKIGEQTTDATGAANAHNNTKVVNNTDKSDAQTDVRDDVDTKTSVKDNTKDSNTTIATKEVGKTVKNSNDTLYSMFDVDMDAYAEDIYEGSPVKVHCTAHNSQDPRDCKVYGQIAVSENGTVLGYGEMIGGKADIQLANNLKPGNYTLKIHYLGDDKFNPSDVTTTLTVKSQYDANLNIKVDNISVSDDATIDITTNKEIDNEFVSVKLNPTSSVYDVKITNGEGKLNVHNLKAGEYSVTANYKGDEKFRPDNASATFAVDKLDPNFNITVHNVTRVDDALVEITANKEINDEILVKINGSTSSMMMKLKNGEGKFYVHEFNDVTPGKHEVSVSYTGNEKFKSAHESETFILRPGIDPNLSVHVDDISAGQNAVAEITADKNLSGRITVEVSNGNSILCYSTNLTNGKGSFTFHNGLFSGSHKAVVEFEGNEIYKKSKASTTFTVKALDPNLSINVTDITEGETALAEITANNNVPIRTVNVILDTGTTYHVNLDNGKGSLSISNLKPGIHSATVFYGGDTCYKPGAAVTTFAVNEKSNSNLGIHFTNITKVQNALAEVIVTKNLSANVDAKLNTCNDSLAVSNSKLHSTTGNDTTTTVNPQTAGQYLLLQA